MLTLEECEQFADEQRFKYIGTNNNSEVKKKVWRQVEYPGCVMWHHNNLIEFNEGVELNKSCALVDRSDSSRGACVCGCTGTRCVVSGDVGAKYFRKSQTP